MLIKLTEKVDGELRPQFIEANDVKAIANIPAPPLNDERYHLMAWKKTMLILISGNVQAQVACTETTEEVYEIVRSGKTLPGLGLGSPGIGAGKPA